MAFDPIQKGLLGERTVNRHLCTLDESKYTIFHDVIIPSGNETTQIDHIVISQFGIFVIETKSYSGVIVGREREPNWTQCLPRKKTSFQNPIRQNYRHKKSLSEVLKLPEDHFHTLVVFTKSNCIFKRERPDEVLLLDELLPRVLSKIKEVLSPSDVSQAIRSILDLRHDPNLTLEKHIESLNERFPERRERPEQKVSRSLPQPEVDSPIKLLPVILILIVVALCISMCRSVTELVQDKMSPASSVQPTTSKPRFPVILPSTPKPRKIQTVKPQPHRASTPHRDSGNVPNVRAVHAEVLPDDGSERFLVVPLPTPGNTNN